MATRMINGKREKIPPFPHHKADVDRIYKFVYPKSFISQLTLGKFAAVREVARGRRLKCVLPRVMLLDPTSACNLKCKGCWAADYSKTDELSFETLDDIVTQAEEIGMTDILLSGGEPLLRKDDILKLCRKHRETTFACFTNATLIDEAFADEIADVENLNMLISIEGTREETDFRRGEGTHDKCLQAMKILQDRNIGFAFSACYHAKNYETISSDEFLDDMRRRGAWFGWLFNYVPLGKDADLSLVCSPEQRAHMMKKVNDYSEKHDFLILDFWNIGHRAYGCVGAGNGFVHINANGDVEPCAFCHYSDSNIHEKTLLEALQSPFFTKFRAAQPFSETPHRSCPMVDVPDALTKVVNETGARSTHYFIPESAEELTAKTRANAEKWKPVAEDLSASLDKKQLAIYRAYVNFTKWRRRVTDGRLKNVGDNARTVSQTVGRGIIATVLAVALLTSGIYGCVPKSGDDEGGGGNIGNTFNNESTPSGGNGSADATPEGGNEQIDFSPTEQFAQGLTDVLIETSHISAQLQSMQTNFISNQGASFDDSSTKGHSVTTLTVTAPDDPDSGDIVISLEQSLDPSSGDAFFKMNFYGGDDMGDMPEAAVYFTGGNMLIKPSSAEKPMIQHAIPSDVAASLHARAALSRYMYMIESADTPALTGDLWTSAVANCVNQITSTAADSDIHNSEEAMEIMGQSRSVQTQTLTLTGEQAATATRVLAELLEKDYFLKSTFLTSVMIDEDASAEEMYGMTEEELEALTTEERMELVNSVLGTGLSKLISDLGGLPTDGLEATLTATSPNGDGLSLLRLDTQGSGSSCAIELVFYTEGFGSHIDIAFRGFDGSRVTLAQRNIPQGGDRYQGSFEQEAFDSDGTMQSRLSATYDSTQTDSSMETDMRMTLVALAAMGVAVGDASQMTFEVTAHYSRQATASGSYSTSSGTLAITAPNEETGRDETVTLNFEMTMPQDDAPIAVTPPQFIPDSGIGSASHAELLNALGMNEEAAMRLGMVPFQAKMMMAIMLLYSSDDMFYDDYDDYDDWD